MILSHSPLLMDSHRSFERREKSPRSYDRHDDYETRERHSSRARRSRSRHRSRRRWPPSPKVESEREALAHEYRPILFRYREEEAQSRGTIDQQPLIEDAFPTTHPQVFHEPSPPRQQKDHLRGPNTPREAYRSPLAEPRSEHGRPQPEPNSSSEISSGPKTPVDHNVSNLDRRYVFVPESGTEIPITYDEPREPIFRTPKETPSHDVRGRKPKPALGLDTSRRPSPTDVPPRERAPSPYSFTPIKKENETPRKGRFSGEYLLSPDPMSPKYNMTRNSARQASADPRLMSASKQYTREEPPLKGLPRQTRPPIQRHASANADPASNTPEKSHGRHSSRYILSSSDSDFSPDEFRKARKSKESSRKPKDLPRHEDTRGHRRVPSGGPYRARIDSEGSKRRSPTPTPPRDPGATVPALAAANILLTNPHFGARKASPRESPVDSPTISPNATPPGTPPNERAHKRERDHSLRHHLTTSKPTSPRYTPPLPTPPPDTAKVRFAQQLDSSQPNAAPANANGMDDLEGRPQRPQLRSRQTSPLPSPDATKLGSGPSINIRSASPYLHPNPQPNPRDPSPSGRRRSSSHSGHDIDSIKQSASPGRQRSKTDLHSEDGRHSSRHLSLAPFDLPSTPNGKPVDNSSRRRAHSSVSDARPDLKDLASSSNRTASTAPPRSRYIPPPCPRTVPQAGHQDWSITRSGPDSLVICPTCRQSWSSFHDFAYRHLIPAPRSFTGKPTRCTFTDPWISLAWRELQRMKKPDIDILYDIADNLADEEPCPDNSSTSRRTWYRVVDPSNAEQISGFDVCGTCVTNIEILWPASQAIFQRSDSRHNSAKRLCALRPSSGRRFHLYTEMLANMNKDVTSQAASSKAGKPNIQNFISRIHHLHSMRECRRDKMLEDGYWHIIPTLPELTVCEDCFDDVVSPAIRQGSTLAGKFDPKSRKLRKRNGSHSRSQSRAIDGSDEKGRRGSVDDEMKLSSCQLYSPRMRKIFAEACVKDDMKYLEDKAWDRFDAERDLLYRRTRTKELEKGSEEEQQELRDIEREWREVE